MSKTLALVGAGPGIGLSIARRFGSEGFKVGLVARSRENLDSCVGSLAESGIEGAGFVGDATDVTKIAQTLRSIEEHFGTIDVLEWSAAQDPAYIAFASETTLENLDYQFGFIRGAVAAVRTVLPGMVARGDGALLFTIGGSGRYPIASHASSGIAMASLRMYGRSLNKELAEAGIYSGVMTVAGPVRPGSDIDPDRIADLCWEMCAERDRDEEVVGDVPAAVARYMHTP